MRIIFHITDDSDMFKSDGLRFGHRQPMFLLATSDNYIKYFSEKSSDWADEMK